MLSAIINRFIGLELRFVAVNLESISVGVVVGSIEIVVVAIPSDPMIEAEAHLRCDELVSRHAAEVPLTDVTRGIVRFFEDFRNTGFRQRKRQIVRNGFVVQRVFTCHQAPARWHAYRDIGEGIRKEHPFLCELIHRRRLDLRVACASDITLAMLVAENKN